MSSKPVTDRVLTPCDHERVGHNDGPCCEVCRLGAEVERLRAERDLLRAESLDARENEVIKWTEAYRVARAAVDAFDKEGR